MSKPEEFLLRKYDKYAWLSDDVFLATYFYLFINQYVNLNRFEQKHNKSLSFKFLSWKLLISKDVLHYTASLSRDKALKKGHWLKSFYISSLFSGSVRPQFKWELGQKKVRYCTPKTTCKINTLTRRVEGFIHMESGRAESVGGSSLPIAYVLTVVFLKWGYVYP